MQTITNNIVNTQSVADAASVDTADSILILQLPTPMYEFIGGGGAIDNMS